MDKQQTAAIRRALEGLTPAQVAERVAVVRAEIHQAREETIRYRKLGKMDEARLHAERWQAQIRLLGVLTGRKLPVPPMAACLRLPG
jgi:hypothetical protein